MNKITQFVVFILTADILHLKKSSSLCYLSIYKILNERKTKTKTLQNQ